MKIELEFAPPEDDRPAAIRIILNPSGESPMSGLPCVTRDLKTLEELETQLEVIEKQIGKIRKEAGKFFRATAQIG